MKDIKYPEEVMQEHNEKLFTNICTKNVPKALYHSFQIEAAIKGIPIRSLQVKAMKEYRDRNPITTICKKEA